MNRLSDNSIFRLVSRIAAPVPTWAEFEAADADRKTEIRRQWKNANTDEAVRLCIRAGRQEQIANEQAGNAERLAWAQRRIDYIKKHAPWTLKYPPGTFRAPDDGFDHDVLSSGFEDYTSNPKQSAT
jgi:hypothetical protein